MSSDRLAWCLLPTPCARCRRVMWLVRAVERLLRIPAGLPCPDLFERYCLVCVALETKP